MRQRIGLEYARALESLGVEARLRDDVGAAVHWYRLLVEHDPISTTSVLGLISTLADAHEPLEALECYRHYCELLRAEYDAQPDAKVRLAADHVRRSLGIRSSGPHSAIPGNPAEIPTLPPIFAEPQRTTRRTSGPAPEPIRPPKRRWW